MTRRETHMTSETEHLPRLRYAMHGFSLRRTTEGSTPAIARRHAPPSNVMKSPPIECGTILVEAIRTSGAQ